MAILTRRWLAAPRAGTTSPWWVWLQRPPRRRTSTRPLRLNPRESLVRATAGSTRTRHTSCTETTPPQLQYRPSPRVCQQLERLSNDLARPADFDEFNKRVGPFRAHPFCVIVPPSTSNLK